MSAQATLRYQAVHKHFGVQHVLRGLTVELPLDRVTFLVGGSGSGKSVLCRMAVGLLRPDGGEVHLLGNRVDQLPERQLRALRQRTPYLVQGPALLDWLTLEENLALVTGGDRARARGALERLGLDTIRDRYPTELGPGVNKRVAIARALALQPRFLLFDEPTTGLDRAAASQVNEAIAELRKGGLGALVVSHDYRALSALADEVVVVADGICAFQGTAAAFERSSEPAVEALRWTKTEKAGKVEELVTHG